MSRRAVSLLARARLGQLYPSSNHSILPTAWSNDSNQQCKTSVNTSRSFSSNPSLSDIAASAIAEYVNPAQLGAQVWELAHATTGLPWWAAIPMATVTLRTLLLPLTLKAKASSATFSIIHYAIKQQGEITHSMGGQPLSFGKRLSILGQSVRHLREKHGVPSFAWWTLNFSVQSFWFISLSLALKQMTTTLWPGFQTEGLLHFVDLTIPGIGLDPLSAPMGTAGAILPLTLMLSYLRALELSAVARSPSIMTPLQFFALPYFVVTCLQPHANVLYWGSNAAFHYAVQRLANTPSSVKSSLIKVPRVLVAPHVPVLRKDAGFEAESMIPEKYLASAREEGAVLDDVNTLSEQADFYKRLGVNFAVKLDPRTSAMAFKRATALNPSDLESWEGLARAYAVMAEWTKASEAYIECAQNTTEPEAKASALVKGCRMLTQGGDEEGALAVAQRVLSMEGVGEETTKEAQRFVERVTEEEK